MAVPHLSVAERVARGKAARAEVPRSRHAVFEPSPDRVDPVTLLERQAETRVPELVPIRYGRMLVSPFTFYRGAAMIMAQDLGPTPRSGLNVQCCGDAHLSNFGVFASPERRLVFDVNDFDETLPGPWEWDVKRLAVSMLIAARDNGYRTKDEERIVLDTVARYRTAMAEFAGMKNLEVWYSRLEIESVLEELAPQFKQKIVKRTEKALAKARTKDSMTAFSKLTQSVNGDVRIVDQSPLIVPIEQLAAGHERDEMFEALHQLLRRYRDTLEFDRRVLLEEFELTDFARKVVGVGSVGTRAWIALLLGRDGQDPLFLQMKEAEASVLEEILGPSEFSNHGERVVTGQRLMQATSDIFLGWLHVDSGLDEKPRDFYGRQLKDWKGSAEIEQMVPKGHGHVRHAVRLDARACARPQRRPDRNRVLPRQRRQLRPRDPRVLKGLRRAERTRLPTARGGSQVRPDHRRDGSLMPDRALGKPAFGRRQRPPGIRVAQVRVLRREQWGSSPLLTALARSPESGDDRVTARSGNSTIDSRPGSQRPADELARSIPASDCASVAAARQDERVDPVERQRRISRQHTRGRQHDRGGARPFHGLYVVIVQDERFTRPRSPPRFRPPHRQAHNRHRSSHRHSMKHVPRLPLGEASIVGGQPSPRNDPIRPATRSWAVPSAGLTAGSIARTKVEQCNGYPRRTHTRGRASRRRQRPDVLCNHRDAPGQGPGARES